MLKLIYGSAQVFFVFCIFITQSTLAETHNGLPDFIELSNLGSNAGLALHGENETDQFGMAVNNIGDINGDGTDDFSIGSCRYFQENMFVGKAYVVFGSPSFSAEMIDVSKLDGTNGFAILGQWNKAFPWTCTGSSVTGGADINGDGIADFVIGASDFADSAADGMVGRSYVIFGRGSGFPAILQLDLLTSDWGVILEGNAEDRSGFDLAVADINGDKFFDVIIGAPDGRRGEYRPGRAYVVFGRQTKFPSIIHLEDLKPNDGFAIFGESGSSGKFGHSVSSGDVNGDGYGDIVVGAPDVDSSAGKVYVIYGNSEPADTNAENISGSIGFQIGGCSTYSGCGTSVASGGDINGDGFEDIAMGAPFALGQNYSDGHVYVSFGAPDVNLSYIDVHALNGWTYPGFFYTGSNREFLGTAVAIVRDINGDQLDELALGGPANDFNRGRSHVVFGRRSGWTTMLISQVTEKINIMGPYVYSSVGADLAGGGDFNQDGIYDLIIGAPGSGSQMTLAGRAYVIYGSDGIFWNSFD